MRANLAAKRQNSGDPKNMGGWTFLLFFNKGDGLSWATFINGSRMQYTRGPVNNT